MKTSASGTSVGERSTKEDAAWGRSVKGRTVKGRAVRGPSTRIALAAALVLGLAAGPLAVPAFAAGAPAPAASAPAAFRGPDAEALRAALAGLPDAEATAASIRVGGKGRWHGTAGVRSLSSGAPALENARFRAGSTTKVVTAALVLQLAAEGRIDLSAPVETYLPGLLPSDTFTEPVTVRHLLTYTSGIQAGRSWGNTVEDEYPHRFGTITPEEVVATGIARGPAFTAGTRQQYNNINYTVLGMLIEKVTGERYADRAAARIFRPLGMRDTSFPQGPDPRLRGPHNRGYQLMRGQLVDVTEWNMSDRWAAGDMISTTADLERFLVALFRGRVVPEPQLREMFTLPGVPGATRSAGLERFVINGRVVWGKSGARPGYQTGMAATRDLSRTVVFSANSTDAKGDEAGRIAQRFGFPAFNR
ncbi:serine hydrolase domain-containing protein [Streptomyces yaizuensis]|uniref:Serine hydrolase n=1 Tax=Streptomyces yaizuensis TaxID=2989713 RepID=A0ABQ5P2N3_9ACTN|nr:serine hydrolase domain-containing protein [Streptomyces sp. YSPA8]GLF96859.1 serine hydrolase [Streptomyces sp. YSPA8]